MRSGSKTRALVSKISVTEETHDALLADIAYGSTLTLDWFDTSLLKSFGSGSVKRGDIAKSSSALSEEEYNFRVEVDKVKKWWATERFSQTKRPYTAEEVVRLRSPLTREYAGTVPALKLGALIKSLAPNGGFSHTFGCLDTVQVVQMAPYLSTIYVSGWQSSSTASTTNEPGPDLADYPYTT